VYIARLMLVVMAIFSATVFAQSDDEIAGFNAAWREYRAAVETDDIEHRTATAKNAMEIGRTVIAETDQRLPLLMINYGVELLAGRQNDSATKILGEALELSESIHGKDSMELVPILTKLARADESHDGRKRRSYFRRALGIVADDQGKDSDAYTSLLLKAGISLYSTDEWDIGERYVRDAYKHSLESLGADSFQTGVAAFYLGKFAHYQRKNKMATDYLYSALDGFGGDDEDSRKFQLHARAMLVAVLESRGRSDEATEHCIAIGRLSQVRPDQDYLPLFRQAPRYPPELLGRGREGFVEVSFTVDELGFVRDPKVINEGDDHRGFAEAALKAVERFRYAPRFEDGEAVAVEGVKTRITFELVD
jgi:TonB family protein